MFRNREDAGRRLAARLKGRELRNPLVLAIPRGGVVVGAALARELGAELDVVLARKLRAPNQPEFAIGVISETGRVYLSQHAERLAGLFADYLAEEVRFQRREIERRRELFRRARPPAPVAGRSVIVTDDGLTTGATMTAALRVVKSLHPHELIVAVPVASPDRLAEVRRSCDEVICLFAPEAFAAIGPFCADFRQVEDEEVVQLLQAAAPDHRSATRAG